MRHRWANTSLLVLVVFQVATGTFGLAAGSQDREVFLWLHNAGAFTIAAVLFWKAAISARSLKRPAGDRPRAMTIVLALMLVVTLVLGFTWPSAGYWSVAGISGISFHIWVAIALTPLFGFHAYRYTRGFKTGYDADRRAAIRLFGLGGAGLLTWLAVEGAYNSLGIAAASRRFTGSHERGSFRGNAFPSTSWLNDNPERVDPGEWRMRVSGVNGGRADLVYEDMLGETGRFTAVTAEATLDCTGGWYSTQRWRGVRLKDLLEPVASEGAQSVEVTSVTGYYRKFAIEAAVDFVLATHVGDEPLSHRHGAPVRLVAPGRRGFEWVKWVTSVKLSKSTHWLQFPFPLQ